MLRRKGRERKEKRVEGKRSEVEIRSENGREGKIWYKKRGKEIEGKGRER